MIKILSIKETKEKNILSLLIFKGEDTSRYTLDSAFVKTMQLSPGDEITEEMLSEISSRAEYVGAKRRALSILSYADNSKATLRQKLRQAGVGRECAERVTEEMVSLGYIDEHRQLERLVSRLAGESLFGPKKIMARLVSKGYAGASVRQAMRLLTERGEVDFAESRRLLLEKYGVSDGTEEASKLLYKNGY